LKPQRNWEDNIEEWSKMSEEWKRGPSGSKGGPAIPTNSIKKFPFIQKFRNFFIS
jgi:hypothetical protein